MSQSDSDLKAKIVRYLKDQNLDGEEIPRSSIKTPDLIVDRGTPDETLIEIKEKKDDPVEMAELNVKLQNSRIVGRSKAIDQWNNLDGVIEHGVRQLTAHDPSRAAHHVIWFHCGGFDGLAVRNRLLATIYGSRKLVSSSIEHVVTAFYFDNSAFFRHRLALDGIVMSGGNKPGLFLNGFSERLGSLLESKFAAAFTMNYVAENQSNRSDVMICDPSASRGDDMAMLDHLRAKYHVEHLQFMNMEVQMGIVGTARR